MGRSEYPSGDIGHRHRQEEESGVEPLVEEENAAVDSDTLNEENKQASEQKLAQMNYWDYFISFGPDLIIYFYFLLKLVTVPDADSTHRTPLQLTQTLNCIFNFFLLLDLIQLLHLLKSSLLKQDLYFT